MENRIACEICNKAILPGENSSEDDVYQRIVHTACLEAENEREQRMVDGADLRVGDTIELWGRRDTITSLRPYDGSIDFLADARIATFAVRTLGTTIEGHMRYEVFHRAG